MNAITLPGEVVVAAITAVGAGAAWLIRTLVTERRVSGALKVEIKASAKELPEIIRKLEGGTGIPSLLPRAAEEHEELRTEPALMLTPQLRREVDRLARRFLEEQAEAEELERERNRGRGRLEPHDITPRETPRRSSHGRVPFIGIAEDRETPEPTEPTGASRKR